MDIHDIAIAGGGPNGLITALALADQNASSPFSVVVIDTREIEATKKQTSDGRAFAITETSQRMFQALNIWDQLAPHAQPMKTINVTNFDAETQSRPTFLNFDRTRGNAQQGAFIIESHFIFNALLDAAINNKNIEFLSNRKIVSVKSDTAKVRVIFENSDNICARLLVGADGRNSSVRKFASIETFGWDYKQHAITLAVEHKKPHGGVADEHFYPAGPFAILPLTGNRSSLVWSETPEETARIMALSDEEFQEELVRKFGDQLGKVQPLSKRFSHPLCLKIAKRFVGNRVALVGDAAHVLHPLAGLGFNLGMRDAAALAEVIMKARSLGLDFASVDVLEEYESWRRADTLMVATATEGLNQLFSNDSSVLNLIRKSGLNLVDRIGPLKDFFVKEAAGFGGQLPKYMEGEIP